MKKTLKLFHIFLKNIFGLKYEIDNKIYRKTIYHFLRWNEHEHQSVLITHIKVFKHKKRIIVEIETHRPGLLIGKGGKFIDELKDFVEDNTKQKIEIDLRESKLWMNLYDNKTIDLEVGIF